MTNFRLLISRPSTLAYIDKLHTYLLNICKDISEIEYTIFFRNNSSCRLSLENDYWIARLYFHLYTIPLLESANLLNSKQIEQAVYWGRIHLYLCLYTRYTDYVVDNDHTLYTNADILKRTYIYLSEAQSLLRDGGYRWEEQHNAICMQFFEYENEVRQGYIHDFSSLWRRVSPLCLLSETYMKNLTPLSNFSSQYRYFLSWSLLHADCDDVLQDLSAQRKTPITILLGENSTNTFTDLSEFAKQIQFIKTFLDQIMAALSIQLEYNYPIWLAIIKYMNHTFAPGSLPVDKET